MTAVHPGSRRACWVPAVIAPTRGWGGMAGSHRGSRYLLGAASFAPSRDDYATFETRAQCLEWIMAHRVEIAARAPGTKVRAVSLAEWLLGLD